MQTTTFFCNSLEANLQHNCILSLGSLTSFFKFKYYHTKNKSITSPLTCRLLEFGSLRRMKLLLWSDGQNRMTRKRRRRWWRSRARSDGWMLWRALIRRLSLGCMHVDLYPALQSNVNSYHACNYYLSTCFDGPILDLIAIGACSMDSIMRAQEYVSSYRVNLRIFS